ncbi:MAG: HD domain-containing protein, partial [Spirochaetales bacterium]|nr:HD domain-containing protein [Spirochaetales bacterium]
MKDDFDPDETFDFRDAPPAKGRDNQDYSVLETLEPVDDSEEIFTLEDLGEEEQLNFPWALFTDSPREENPLANENMVFHTKQVENSSIPTCFMDLDLKIFWYNKSFESKMHFITTLPHVHLPELFQGDSKGNLGMDLKSALEDETRAYSWSGRLLPIGRHETSTFLKAMIQPCFCPDRTVPRIFMLQLDIITKEYNQLLQKTFMSLLEASKLKDNDTGEHIGRVNEYSKLLSRHLLGRKGYEEITEEFIEDIGFLASMHDVGKIGTPDDILNKSGPLDDWEREIMNEHTKNGAYILSTYPKAMARDIALSHHEKWDGSGYPYGIFEEMIP